MLEVLINGARNIAWMKCHDLMNQDQHIEVAIAKQSDQLHDVYRRRLAASIACICLLLKMAVEELLCKHGITTSIICGHSYDDSSNMRGELNNELGDAHEFSSTPLEILDNELGSYIIDMRRNVEFSSLKGICDLSEKLVENGIHYIVYPRVYLLLKLAMILPIATTTVEKRIFYYEDYEDYVA